MNCPREELYQALFEFWSDNAIQGSENPFGLLKTIGRRLRMWTDVPVNEQPAAFQVQGTQKPIGTNIHGITRGWEHMAEIVIYANSGEDMSEPPAALLNPILDYFERLFPTNGIPQTLGGLVREVRIASSGIRTDEGALGPQAVAIVPLRIVTL